MKKVTLLFPDTTTLADFIITYEVNHIDVNSGQLTISGPLSEELIAIACLGFDAEIKQMPVIHLI